MITPGTAQGQNRETDSVSFTVQIEGKQVNMDPGGIISFSIHLELSRIPVAKIIIADGSVERQKFEKADNDLFAPGSKIEILAGYQQKEESLFKGIITKQSVKIQSGRNYKLEIECRDLFVQTTLVKNSRYFTDQSDTDTWKQMVQDYPALGTSQVADTNFKHPELVQYHCTDWDFMLMRAEANGMYLLAADGKLSVATPEVKATADLSVQFGQGSEGIPLLEFEADIDARNHYGGVQGSAWDVSKQELVDETAGNSGAVSFPPGVGGAAKKQFTDVLFKDRNVKLYHGGDLDSAEVSAWVGAKMRRGELSRVRGRAAVVGIKVLPGATLAVHGISDRYNGNHLVSGVLHQFLKGHWRTDIQFGWSQENFAEQTTSTGGGGLYPGVNGLQAGLVSAIENDPRSGSARVQVRLPYLAGNPGGSVSDGVWARLVSLYAGNKYGFVMRPEVGDEVIVGFINNDPNDAVVIGGVHSDKNEAPSEIPAQDSNPVKGFVSKGGLQCLFDDDKNKIHLSTGSGDGPSMDIDGKNKKIVISLDSSNSVELSSSGVKINGTRIDLN